ncbi:MAG: cytochrome c biogenesis protein CcdA [Candidatus Krumholzibacteria bacterium]|nr:cytochrome c biogenesis protein CcdA [Candidatus Krumholzibacteria bacterium]
MMSRLHSAARLAASLRSAVAIAAAALALTAVPHSASAQFDPTGSGNLVSTTAAASLSIFHPGSRGHIAVTASVRDGWHINAHEPLDSYLIPTVLEVIAPEGIAVEGILYPPPELMKLEISEGEMALYHGSVVFGAAVRVARDAAPGEYEIRAVLRYQGCNNLTCLEPASAGASITIRVGTLGETAEPNREDIFSEPLFAGGAKSRGGPAGGSDGSFSGMIENRGLLLTFIFVFLGGLALNLTPCVYPLIPITVSYFGGQAGGRGGRTIVLALLYVLGMSITYSVLGTVAAMTGGLFGSALQNPLVILFIAAVLLGLAASMFGLWEFRMPAFLTRRTGRAKQGYGGAVMMGLTVGIVAAPCIGPFVLGLLTYVGEMGRPLLGFLLFFTLAWGMGAPFIVLGTVSGSISKLPRSGHWMIWVRKIFGFILIMMAIYFARHIIGERLTYIGYGLTALVASLVLGWLDRTPQTGRGFAVLRTIVGAAWIAVGAFILTIPGGPFVKGGGRAQIEWVPFTREALSAATAKGKPAIIDFSADWCIPCRELEHRTFTDERVIEYAEGFVRLKVDLTTIADEQRALKSEYDVRGVPTIVFIDPAGVERRESRVTGFVEPEVFLERMKAAAGG